MFNLGVFAFLPKILQYALLHQEMVGYFCARNLELFTGDPFGSARILAKKFEIPGTKNDLPFLAVSNYFYKKISVLHFEYFATHLQILI